MSFASLLGRSSRLFQSFLLVGALVCQVHAQSPAPLVRGRVVDASGAPISGAQITTSQDTRTAGAAAVSDQNGEFSLQLLPGTYTVEITKIGFMVMTKTANVTQETLQLGELVLRIAPINSSVTVQAPDSETYQTFASDSATKTPTALRDVPQSITVVTQTQIRDQQMTSIGDVMRYVPGVSVHQGENNRDQLVIRGNSTSADFFLDGIRDDVQYYRDIYNADRIEIMKGPNAMIFGRGGGGGVINRVTKTAVFTPLREITFQGGSFDGRRFTADLDQPLGSKVAFRLNGVYEHFGSFRDYVSLDRYGLNPTLTFAAGKDTKITVSYENFHDHRIADRGITSFNGLPVNVPISTYYGNPNDSYVRALVNFGSVAIEHRAGRFTVRNRTQFGAYSRMYQNYVPGAVNSMQTLVTLTAYNNATKRLNIFNQTDVTFEFTTGSVKHTFLTGVEIGRQLTDNFRNTGFFNNSATSLSVPYSSPVISTPVTFRQAPTDADNHLVTHVLAPYIQDQIELSQYVQVIAGVRFDYFDLQYHNNRDGSNLRRINHLVSPRAGIIFKPIVPVSIYANYSMSYLPSSGDQFSSLTTITQQVKPERFDNYEIGTKWDVNRVLSLTMAAYRLDRTNTRSTDPNDPTRIIQTGSTRTYGSEFALTGTITRAWKVTGGYAYQNAFISSATTSALAGAQVGQVPHNNFSLWNNFRITSRMGAGLGIINRSDMWVATDNSVRLPGYTRADAAFYFSLTEKIRFQVNIENLSNTKYFTNADSNTNISPGSGIVARGGIIARF